jgi:hypothetical protein
MMAYLLGGAKQADLAFGTLLVYAVFSAFLLFPFAAMLGAGTGAAAHRIAKRKQWHLTPTIVVFALLADLAIAMLITLTIILKPIVS